MEFREMSIEQMEERKAEIKNLLEADDADLDALENEVRAINEEIENRKSAEAKRVEIRKAVASGEGTVVVEKTIEERKTMTFEEIRSSKEYINAFADYIKTEDDTECRKLLSTNSDIVDNPGQVPVPTMIEGRIRTAWERNGLMNLVRKTYIKGNVQIGFELSATGADIHKEGAPELGEEELTLGVVTMIPNSIKKWITISDEALDMGGEEFLNYIYDEITYQIAKKAQAVLVDLIVKAGAVATATAVGVPAVTSDAATVGVVAEALGLLSDEATNPVVVMNKQTWSAFKAAQYEGNFNVDPFEGLTVYYDNTLPSVASATAGQPWLIVGDFGVGAQANFPNGDAIRIKFDDMSLAELDLVKLVGREYIALGLVADKAFVKVVAE